VRVAPLYVERAFSVKLDAVLGVDTLSSFDIDIDLPSHRLALYQKQTCAGAAPAWTGPYATILARRSSPVTISACQCSSTAIASLLGADPRTAGVLPLGPAGEAGNRRAVRPRPAAKKRPR
jgi:hypothetical protein